MLADLFDSQSVTTFVGEHLDDKILELSREALGIGLFPVLVKFACQDEFVIIIVLFCFFKRKSALYDYKKNDGGREHIGLHAVVDFALLDLRSHVSLRPMKALQEVNFVGCGEAKVCDLQVHLIVDQNILKLEVAMGHAFFMDVLKHIEHLMEKKAAFYFAHAAETLTEVQQVAAGNVIKHDVDDVGDLAAAR